jgi:hypothetical protein
MTSSVEPVVMARAVTKQPDKSSGDTLQTHLPDTNLALLNISDNDLSSLDQELLINKLETVFKTKQFIVTVKLDVGDNSFHSVKKLDLEDYSFHSVKKLDLEDNSFHSVKNWIWRTMPSIMLENWIWRTIPSRMLQN